jgi:hypothetical protein
MAGPLSQHDAACRTRRPSSVTEAATSSDNLRRAATHLAMGGKRFNFSLVQANPGSFGIIDIRGAHSSRRAAARHDGCFCCGLKWCAASCSRPTEGGGREQNTVEGKAASVGRRRGGARCENLKSQNCNLNTL